MTEGGRFSVDRDWVELMSRKMGVWSTSGGLQQELAGRLFVIVGGTSRQLSELDSACTST